MKRELPPWNHNIHYYPLILAAIGNGARRALDVGCGDGLLAGQLWQAIPHVVAIDSDAAVLGRARHHDGGSGVEYLHGDFLTHDFEPASFDAIVSVAALHHMDAAVALGRMRQLLRPGGTLAVVGLARRRYPRDLPVEVAAIAAHQVLRMRKGYWEHSSPTIWPPPLTYDQTRPIAVKILPGVQYRRHLLWRYSLVWRKPET
ncbi:MAG TPA: class I SAM-dependent methyltransferase [Streptosporangiaceae bacterium]